MKAVDTVIKTFELGLFFSMPDDDIQVGKKKINLRLHPDYIDQTWRRKGSPPRKRKAGGDHEVMDAELRKFAGTMRMKDLIQLCADSLDVHPLEATPQEWEEILKVLIKNGVVNSAYGEVSYLSVFRGGITAWKNQRRRPSDAAPPLTPPHF